MIEALSFGFVLLKKWMTHTWLLPERAEVFFYTRKRSAENAAVSAGIFFCKKGVGGETCLLQHQNAP